MEKDSFFFTEITLISEYIPPPLDPFSSMYLFTYLFD